MSWIKSRWQGAAVLVLAAAAIAVPAWASSGGGGRVQSATKPPDSRPGARETTPLRPSGKEWPPSRVRELKPLPPRPSPQQLDGALQCMSDRGFDMGTADSPGVLIPRSETQTDEFRRAAKACELPPPPTDAQIRQMACHADRARREETD